MKNVGVGPEIIVASDNCHSAVTRLQQISVQARRSLRKASLIVASPSKYHEEVVERMGTPLKFLRTSLALRDLTVIFDIFEDYPASTGGGFLGSNSIKCQSTRRLWHPIRRLMLQNVGLLACKTLVLRYSHRDDVVGYEALRDFAFMCESIGQTMRKGSYLENLKIAFPPPFWEYGIDHVDSSALVVAAETWDAVTSLNALVSWEHLYWLLPLTRIKGLRSIKVTLYDRLSTAGASQELKPAQVDGLQAFLDSTMLAGAPNAAQDTRLDFRFDSKGRLVWKGR
ncbi:hypothetical protein OEA41_008719 [Lepraria neglecta]|uniref:Uncharacterized protein n=1 Tax=Lepraria neglecta TaxID=209136 RepID=A0AAD9Z0M6_9LECA|nr:hypothetical protein OEA41_008719 [Lepraria neglecta]